MKNPLSLSESQTYQTVTGCCDTTVISYYLRTQTEKKKKKKDLKSVLLSGHHGELHNPAPLLCKCQLSFSLRTGTEGKSSHSGL